MKIRFLKDYREFRKGQVVNIRFSKALQYIGKGIAVKDKMMSEYHHG